MKHKHKLMFLDMAEIAAKTSTAKRLKVGAVLVKDSRILSIGINGTVPGADNNCEDLVDGKLVTKNTVSHAEMQSIYKAARDGQALNGASLFCNYAPCLACAIALVNTGISNVYYRHSYRSTDGIEFLVSNNVSVESIIEDK